ncbi:hypothetical protein L2E82_16960 [Cichorium intybus]|uniref:Uncharacterized protein n=1 Tax=Cichorium intybus TaxID=13427 RepID=A0ACB9F6Y5_CICIN|nr:hypothetical protein L2E82_16960 [Cichorium intybus]
MQIQTEMRVSPLSWKPDIGRTIISDGLKNQKIFLSASCDESTGSLERDYFPGLKNFPDVQKTCVQHSRQGRSEGCYRWRKKKTVLVVVAIDGGRRRRRVAWSEGDD